MDKKKRVFVYIDGSNFYNLLKNNYGEEYANHVDFHELAIQISDPNKELLQSINYYNAPVNQQDHPTAYANQNKFLAKLRENPIIKVFLGNLRKRPHKKIHISCSTCGHQEANLINCPSCDQEIDLLTCFRYSEKGVDVKLAISMLMDALEDKYDTAFLLSSDADFVPAIDHIIKKIKKDVIYCHFPIPRTNALKIACTESRLITVDIVESALVRDR